ncbi:MAG: AmmeMemoRadiSam system protein A [Chloroflexota bacterium]
MTTPRDTSAADSRAAAGGALTRPVAPEVTPELREALLEIARSAIQMAAGLASGWSLASRIRAAGGSGLRATAFVTLTDGSSLRGCMGTLDPNQPVAEAVAAAAMTASLDDPRFYPVEADELGDLHVHVSILGPPVVLASPADFVPGVDGIIVERGLRLGLLLPEVATGHGWDGERMLAAVCQKAGLPPGAWREPGARCLVFRTVRFGGPVALSHPRRPG